MSFRIAPPSLVVGFDTETTGLDTAEDEIISYGFAVFRNGEYVAEESGQYFAYTERPIHPRAQEIHGLSAEEIRERSSAWGGPFAPHEGVAEARRRLAQIFAQGATVVGAFPKFDFDMIESMHLRYFAQPTGFHAKSRSGFQITGDKLVSHRVLSAVGSKIRHFISPQTFDVHPGISWPEILDVCDFDRRHWPDPTRRRSLTALCEHYAVRPGNHDSLEDARAAAEVWFAQIERWNTHQSQGIDL